MSTDWTAGRLDALPVGIVIECESLEGWWVHTSDGEWTLVGDDIYDCSAGILADNEGAPIRVVSVPVDVLLSGETISLANPDPWIVGTRLRTERTVRAAVAHIVGDMHSSETGTDWLDADRLADLPAYTIAIRAGGYKRRKNHLGQWCTLGSVEGISSEAFAPARVLWTPEKMTPEGLTIHHPELHEPHSDDGVLYCGWRGDGGIYEGCGHVWPCPTVAEGRGR